ncbi:hypothetical protein FH972_007909 [Carpinus fangiana]|uniref:Uncharacterized protein n=1 Tax=Carpinus fangiana TaxID=176857 RepID=A0A5N6QX44_9ROSI|nr:hypothetical protein FH972_007909 [Carpinus fangiana]
MNFTRNLEPVSRGTSIGHNAFNKNGMSVYQRREDRRHRALNVSDLDSSSVEDLDGVRVVRVEGFRTRPTISRPLMVPE